MSWLLERLRKFKNDRGMMADLRCALVENKKHRAWPALHRLGVQIDDQVLPFIAGLFAMHPEETGSGNFGATCLEIKRKRAEKLSDDKLTPTERRFQHLLAAEREEIQGRVLRMILMVKSQGIPVNYEQLENDVRFWNDRTKTEWASSFWAQPAKSSNEEGVL